jgi:hypothetical protein
MMESVVGKKNKEKKQKRKKEYLNIYKCEW